MSHAIPARRRVAALTCLPAAALLSLWAPASALAMSRHAACAMPLPEATLSVAGSGESQVAPDLAIVTVGVSARADTAAAAMAANATAQTAVIAALRAAGVGEGAVQTAGLTLAPIMTGYDTPAGPRVTGYQAQNMVTARVTDLNGLGAVLDAAVAAGANEVQGITFLRRDMEAAEDEARQAAVAEARHRAEVLAEAAGLTLGPVRAIRDIDTGGFPQPMPMLREMAGASDASTPVERGRLGITARVEMDYALAPGGGAAGASQPGCGMMPGGGMMHGGMMHGGMMHGGMMHGGMMHGGMMHGGMMHGGMMHGGGMHGGGMMNGGMTHGGGMMPGGMMPGGEPGATMGDAMPGAPGGMPPAQPGMEPAPQETPPAPPVATPAPAPTLTPPAADPPADPPVAPGADAMAPAVPAPPASDSPAPGTAAPGN